MSLSSNHQPNNEFNRLNKTVERFEDRVDDKLDQIEDKVKDTSKQISKIDRKLWQVQKSTRTLFKMFQVPHEWLRANSKLYYNWHLKSYSKGVHWGTLALSLVFITYLFGFQLGFFGGVRPAIQAAAGIPKMVNYQGKLTNASDIPVADGSYNFIMRIYDDESAGSCLWAWKGTCGTPTTVPVTVANGIFSVLLGDTSYQTTNALTLDFNTDSYWLQVEVGGETLTPRKRLGAVGYAYNSDTVDGYHLNQNVLTSSSPSFSELTLSGGTLTLGSASQLGDIVIYDGSNNTITLQAQSISDNYILTLPTTDGNASQYLKTDGSGNLSWDTPVGGSGDITAVGSMTTGDAFADATATGDWLGLGSGAGRIEFDDQSTDEVNILSANVGIGTATPNEKLTVEGTISLDEQDSTVTPVTLDGYGKLYSRLSNGIDTYTKLMLHADGLDTATTFTDSSDSPYLVTPNGNVQTDTAQQKFGTASALFDGTGDYLKISNSEDFNFGTGGFTIDAWVRFNNTTGTQNLFAYSTSSGAVQFHWDGNHFSIYAPSSTILTTAGETINTNTWYHVAYVRNGNNWQIYIDGTSYASVTDTRSLGSPNHANGIMIGAEVTVPSQYFNGWIDEFRVSKGIARWTSNFTRPTGTYTSRGVFYKTGAGTEFALTGSGGSGGTSLWGQTGSDIYYNSGNVGIGQSIPAAKLEVEVGSTDGVTGLLVDADDADQIAMQIQGSQTTADVIDILADSATTAYALDISADALTTGSAINITSSSTAGSGSNSTKMINIARSGANSNASHTAYGLYSSVTDTGTTSTNVAGYFVASGAINNYAAIFDAGNVGIGDTTPDTILDILSSAAANTQITMTNTNAGDYDPQIGFQVAEGTNTFTIGVDDSDSDKFKISTTALGTGDLLNISASDIVFNESSGDIDFRVEGNNNTNLLFADAGNDLVGIGTASPNEKLTIDGTVSLQEQTSLETATSNYGKIYTLTEDGVDSYTKLMLHADGTDTSTTFYDDSDTFHFLNGHKTTANGNAQIDTASKKFGSASAYFDGTGDYLTLSDSDDWDFGLGNFTIDLWAYPTSTNLEWLFSHFKAGTDYGSIGLLHDNTTLKLYASSNGSSWNIADGTSSMGSITLNAWNHIALVRNGNDYKVYINGTYGGTTVTNAAALYNADDTLAVGSRTGLSAGTNCLTGWIDEFRISKGIARWTTDFSAPGSAYTEQGLYYTDDNGSTSYLSTENSQWGKNGDKIYNTNSSFVGIGTGDPLYQLHVQSSSSSQSGRFDNAYVGGNKIAVFGSAYGDNSGYISYGVFGVATSGGTSTNYGVYGSASGGSTNYAGYFDGPVSASSYVQHHTVEESIANEDGIKKGELVYISGEGEEIPQEAIETDENGNITTKLRYTGIKAPKVSRSNKAYDYRVVGVIASDEDPDKITEAGKKTYVVAGGTYPVLVDASFGDIKPGDPITSSDNPGYGMKATKAGSILGFAMESLDSGKGYVNVWFNLSYFDPEIEEGLQGSTSITTNNINSQINQDLIIFSGTGKTKIVGQLIVTDNTIFDGNIEIKGHVIGSHDTRGKIIVSAGETETEFVFDTPYLFDPSIVASPLTKGVLYHLEIERDKFIIKLEQSADIDLEFSWIAQQ